MLMVLGSTMVISWSDVCGLVRVAVKTSSDSVMSSGTMLISTHCGFPPTTLPKGKVTMVPSAIGL